MEIDIYEYTKQTILEIQKLENGWISIMDLKRKIINKLSEYNKLTTDETKKLICESFNNLSQWDDYIFDFVKDELNCDIMACSRLIDFRKEK
nr:MAG TPA: hypothetical protein [Caudoviricetes sp.]